ncbi:MAG: peptide deformylase [Rickettsiales bacterium]|jgi:peptide deformylase|nr:peptide deformylase [Rickettsiales bacterium]
MLQMYLCFDPVLREVAEPVVEIDDYIRDALDQMTVMMDEQNGVGLAAPQVGISKRFLVMRDVQGPRKSGAPSNAPVLKMINPVITAKSSEIIVREEGCLSVLGPDGPVFADVERPDAVTIEWIDETGAQHARDFIGIPARIAQHEIDHLDGVLFIDYLSSAKREMVMNKVRKRK